jgi:LacI family transcriptional regulator
LEKLKKLDIACVAIDRWNEEMPFPHVAIDNFHGAYLATKHLIKNEHVNIACISGPLNVMSSQDRLAGYKKALHDYNINYDVKKVESGLYNFDSGYEAGLKLLDNPSITAVFVCNDMMAYGFYKACRERNKKIPDDISIVGFDDLLFSSTLDVPLTSLKQSTEMLAAKSCEIIINKLKGINDNNNYVLIPRLSERSSVRNIKNCF